MIKSLYAVRDSAAQAFAQPFLLPSDGMAMRSFRDEVLRQDDNNMMARHPEDFELHCIGAYEEDTGRLFVPEDCPRLLIRGKDCVELK